MFQPAKGEPANVIAPKLPVVFEPNLGRWNPDVLFSARIGDYRVLLSPKGAVLSTSLPAHSISISLVGGNADTAISGVDALRCRTNYFLGNRKEQWRTGVENYGRVLYRSVYPGVDMVYYGAGSELEYDFLVAPGADASRIRLRFDGLDRMAITSEGNLLIESGSARLIEKRPVVYQAEAGKERREVAGKFRLLGKNEVGFELASYDRSHPLVIDPALSYSTLLGTSGNDSVNGVKVDKNGLIYVTGTMHAGDFNGGSAYQAYTAATSNIFIAVIDPARPGSNALVYFSYVGGTAADVAESMALDSAGVVYVTGSTTSTDFPTVAAPQSTIGGGVADGPTDAFALKFDITQPGAGALVFSTYIGGSGAEIGYGIDVDAQGSIYVTGSTESTDFPVTPSSYAGVLYGPRDAFIVKLIPGGGLSYSSFLGGEADDEGRAVAVAPDGTIYLAGDTLSTQFPQAGVQYQPTFLGGGDIFIAHMDLAQSNVNSLLYSTYFGGSKLDAARKITFDPSGKLLLTGYTLSPDFPITPDALQSSLTGPANVFVSRLDLTAPSSSAVLYGTYFGGTGGDVAYDIAADASSNVYLTGYTLSIDFPVTPDALQNLNGGGINVFISKLNITPGKSSLVYSTYAGLDGINIGYGIAASASGAIYAGGQSSADNLATTNNAAQTDFAGGQSDGFVLMLK